jgi:hypothetical protein
MANGFIVTIANNERLGSQFRLPSNQKLDDPVTCGSNGGRRSHDPALDLPLNGQLDPPIGM